MTALAVAGLSFCATGSWSGEATAAERAAMSAGGSAAPARPAEAAGPAAPAVPARRPRLRIDGLSVLDVDVVTRQWQASLDRNADSNVDAIDRVARALERQVRAAGRPFARVHVTEGRWSGDGVRLVVEEGRYGRVDLRGGAARDAAPWVDAIQSGRPIGDELERQVQALSRLPGVTVAAGLGPGVEVGEGDVDLIVEQARRWSLDLRADNHGNRYSGRERGSVAGHVNGLLRFGDRLTASGGANSGKGWEGAVAYQVPLGTQGTRVSLTADHHHYELGGVFAPLEAQGQVDAAGLNVVVPLASKGPGRLTWQIGVEARRMLNEQRSVALADRRQAFAVTTGLQAVSYPGAGTAAWGGVWMEVGDVRLRDASTAAFDAASARSASEYLVLSADVALLKQWDAWGLLLRGSGQMADKNLDPSKKFSLGGVRSVRAWPAGEISGDHGALAQAELRYRWKTLEPFGFIDAGRVKFSHTPWETGTRGKVLAQGRTLAGAGVGVRWQHGPWSAEGTTGWRIGTASQRVSTSDPKARTPQVWVSVSYAL